jgi:hypothetical protein
LFGTYQVLIPVVVVEEEEEVVVEHQLVVEVVPVNFLMND